MAVLSLPMPWRWAVLISWAALLSIEAMIAPRNVVGDGVPRALPYPMRWPRHKRLLHNRRSERFVLPSSR
jgi:hypothetical protein